VAIIEQAQQQLYRSAKMQSVGQLAAGVAHEINNPIGFMTSNLRVAQDYLEELDPKLADDPTSKAMIEDFRDLLGESIGGAQRVARIVADLKTFSNVDHADYTYCNLNDLVNTSLHLLQTRYPDLTPPRTELGELPKIQGYPAQLSEALLNLLDNAAQAVKKGGGITVTSGTNRSGGIRVIIEDDGAGIAEELREQIFDPFFTTRPVGSGIGLGLTEARNIILAHDGQIDVESHVPGGTRVTLQLPVR
jgi:signal transduction histidine kinase